ncbi:MAG: hypothetical protein RMI94_12590 [Bryobacterales bacterium]|nr:hypothetical protein [Bryobacterales bacterium]
MTPAEFAAVLPASELAERVRDFTVNYNRMRFGSEAQAGPALLTALEAIEREAGGKPS